MKKKKWLKNGIVVCLLASFCCALWGSAFPFVKIGYQMLSITSDAVYSQILFAGTRFTLAGIITIIIGSAFAKKLLIPDIHSVFKIIKLSVLQTVVQYVLFYIGLSNTTGVKASIVQGTNVFVALLVASLVFRQEKLTGKKLLGCIIGFVGVVIINFNQNGFSTDIRFLGEGFIFLSTVAYAFSSVMLKKYSQKENTLMLSGYQFLMGGGLMMIIGYLMGGDFGTYSVYSTGVLLYLAVVSAAAYGLWGILLKYNDISRVAVYGFMTPVFGVLLSAVLLNEHQYIGYKCIVSLILVSVGIYVVHHNKIS